MSVINQMLQDLDRRHAEPVAEALPSGAVKPVPRRRARREWFWRIVAALVIVATGWVLWVAWQLQPQRLATDEALRAGEIARKNVAQTAPISQPQAVIAKPQAIVQPTPPAPAPVQPVVAAAAPRVEMEPLKAATTIEPQRPAVAPAPIPVAAPKPAAPAREATKPPAVAAAPAASPAPVARIGLDVPPARILPAPAPRVAQVEKRDLGRGPAERAESEFRRAVALLNQGRVSEAEDSLNAAIAHDAAHEGARQALVALLFERNRMEDARRVLQEGLAINPASVPLAMGLGRLLAERRDYAGALNALRGAQSSASGRADYHALAGTILQRMGRNKEAVEAYGSAVRLAPANGAAWVGMAISLEALERRADAADAFRRAVATGTLSSEVRDFAEQRARNLQ